LRTGYNQLRIRDEGIPKETSQTMYGHHKFVLRFSLTHGPTNFMFLMNNVLSKYQDKLVLVFIDYIFVFKELGRARRISNNGATNIKRKPTI